MKLLICNLKMNHTLKEMIEYKKILEESSISSFLLCPATCYLPIMHSKKYKLCAQNVEEEKKETFTGAVSVKGLKSLDVNHFLVGHMETFATLEEKINKTKKIVEENGLAFVILSETKEEHDYQYTFTKLLGQIRAILSKIPSKYYKNISFIYEPYWLIKTEKALEENFVDNIFYQLKEELKRDYKTNFKLLYGGGLNEITSEAFLKKENIDGILLGSYGYLAKNVVKLLQSDAFSTRLDKTIHN